MHGTSEPPSSRVDFDLGSPDNSNYNAAPSTTTTASAAAAASAALNAADRFRLTELDSDEDTEDASETDMIKEEEYSEMKEQVYQDKLVNLKKQLQMLKEGVHPEYERRMRKLEQSYKERIRLNEICHKYELECIERDYVNEKKAAAREFEEKKVELRENLIYELEEKKKSVETERLTMDFTGDLIMDVKPITTRKLRRRPNDPVPIPEKRRKMSPAQLNYLLDEQQIFDDLKAINKGKIYTPKKSAVDESELAAVNDLNGGVDCYVEDGKLFYEKRCYQRGHTLYIESKESGRFSAVILSISSLEVWVRKTSDHSKVRIQIGHLQKGKYLIRRKSA